MPQRVQNISTGEVKDIPVLTQADGDAGWSPVSSTTPIKAATIVTPVVTPAATTPADAYGDILNETPEQKALRLEQERQGKLAETDANMTIDEAAIRQKKLDEFQAEIDAVNSIYAEKKRVAQIEGQGRLGSDAAIQARRGMIASTFGGAVTNKVEDANTAVINSIESEKQAAITAIISNAKKAATDEIANKTAARKAGAEEYLKYLGEAATRKDTRISDAVRSLISGGLTPDDVAMKTLADQLGVTLQQFKTAYTQAKTTNDAAVKKAALDSEKANLDVQKLRNETDTKLLADKEMIGKGYTYVSTIPERDKLIKSGYELVNYNGRTYAKPGKTTTKTVKVGKTNMLITYDAQGNILKQEAVGGGGNVPTNSNPKNQTVKFNEKVSKPKIDQYFYDKVGTDKKVSPDTYNAAKAAWQADGGTAERFDAVFFKYKDPANPNY